jgi:hypothetical protein
MTIAPFVAFDDYISDFPDCTQSSEDSTPPVIVSGVSSFMGLTGIITTAQVVAALISGLPTTNPHVLGQMWLNSGALMISQG